MAQPRIRMTVAVMDVLDVLTNASPDDPPWGLRFCELTGLGSGTIYPILDRLMKAGWVTDWWEDRNPTDRPRRRYYEITSTGRECYASALRAQNERRARWLNPGTQPGAAS